MSTRLPCVRVGLKVAHRLRLAAMALDRRDGDALARCARELANLGVTLAIRADRADRDGPTLHGGLGRVGRATRSM